MRTGLQVRETLETFVTASDVRSELATDNGKRLFETAGFIPPSNVRRMLGYFSLVGLCRLNEVTGDHEGALRALSPLNPYNRQYLYTTVIPMANVNLYYYAGMAYLMLRRYVDAGRCFNTVLSFLLRVKGYLTCAPPRLSLEVLCLVACLAAAYVPVPAIRPATLGALALCLQTCVPDFIAQILHARGADRAPGFTVPCPAARCSHQPRTTGTRTQRECRKDHRYDLLLHKNEQLYKLLAITVSLCPPALRWCEEQARSLLHALAHLAPAACLDSI